MVAVGTFISAFWILSRQQLDADAHRLRDQRRTGSSCRRAAGATIIFNPSFPYRLVHTVIAAYLTTALVGGRGRRLAPAEGSRNSEHARKMFSMAMWMAALVAPVQIFVGDLHGLNTLEHQPAKVMAMEGHYQSHPDGAPLILFGIPNDEAAAHGPRDRGPEARRR